MEELLGEGLVKSELSGRKKIYSISRKGKKAVTALLREKEEFLEQQLELVRSFRSGKSCEELGSSLHLAHELSKKGDVVLRNMELWADLRTSLMELVIDPGFPKMEPKARRILSQAISDVDELRGGR